MANYQIQYIAASGHNSEGKITAIFNESYNSWGSADELWPFIVITKDLDQLTLNDIKDNRYKINTSNEDLVSLPSGQWFSAIDPLDLEDRTVI